MKKNVSFLSVDDQNIFYLRDDEPDWNRIETRKIVFSESDPKPKTTISPQPPQLDNLFNVFKSSSQHFHCYCVEVKPEDGMTWSAETTRIKAEEQIQKAHSPFEIITVSNQLEKNTPVIIDFFGLKPFLALAKKNNLVTDFYSHYTLSTVLIGLITFIIPIIAALISDDLGKEGGIQNLFTLRYFLLAIGTLAACLLARHYVLRNKLNPRPETLQALVGEIETYCNKLLIGENDIPNRRSFETLVDDLAADISFITPKFVIIDDYQMLDPFTKLVIEKYFRKYKETSNSQLLQKECWVIFERSNNEKFSNNKRKIKGVTGTAYDYIIPLRQNELTETQKEDFLKRNRMPRENIMFSNIKALCTNFEGLDWVEKSLDSYRNVNESSKEFDKLELLYLLALTSFPGKICFSIYEFDTIFENNKLRSELLKGFMYGHDFSKGSMNKLKRSLTEDPQLKELVTVYNSGSTEETLSLTYGAALIINEDSDYYELYSDRRIIKKLDLPDGMLGHAFWATYWYDRLQSNHPNETFWFDKLSYHLTNFDFETLRRVHPADKSNYTANDLLFYITEAYIYTINGSLKTAAFKYIKDVVNYAVLGIQEIQRNLLVKDKNSDYEIGRKELFSKIIRLYHSCCEAYVCLGDKQILKSLQLLSGIYTDLSAEEIKKEEFYPHALIYSEMISQGILKEYLSNNGKSLFFTDKPLFESLEDHIILSSSLLGFTINRIISVKSNLNLGSFTEKESDRISVILQKIEMAVMQSTSKSYSIIDLTNLSLLVWTTTVAIDNNTGLNNDRCTKLISLIKTVTKIVHHLNNDNFRENRKIIKNEFFFSALLSDICSITMAAATSGYTNLDLKDFQTEYSNAVNALILEINDTLDIRYNIIDSPERLIEVLFFNKTIHFMQTTSALWSTLGFSQFADNLNQRIFHFQLISFQKKIDTIKSIILNKAPVYSNPSPYLQFSTQLIGAKIACEIHFDYSYLLFSNAIKIFEGKPNSKNIYKELLVIKIIFTGQNVKNYSLYEKTIMNDEKFISYYTGEFIQKMTEYELDYFILRLTGSLPFDNPVLEKLIPSITNKAKSIDNFHLKKRLLGITKFLTFKKNYPEGPKKGDFENIRTDWALEKDDELYPFLLYSCLNYQLRDDSLLDEIENLFRSAEKTHETNAYTMLSLNYLLITYDDPVRKPEKKVIEYLENNIEKFEAIDTAQGNWRSYLLLTKIGTPEKNNFFSSKLEEWDKIIQEEKRIEFLAQMQNGNFFIAFRSMITNLKSYAEDDKNEMFSKSNTPKKHAPFIESNGKKIISLDFIEYGESLFFDSNFSGSDYDEQRAIVNNAANDSFSEVFNFLIQANSSSYFKDIARRYNNVFKEYTMPEVPE